LKTRIVIADDHAIVREGLNLLLRRRPDIEVIAEAADGEAALRAVVEQRPDVLIADVQMPRMTGIELSRRLRELKSSSAVVLLSMHREPAYVRSALEAGAAGYVLKESASRELLECVNAVREGRPWFSPELGEIDLGPAGLQQEQPLTPRERDVLRLLAQGMGSKEIAFELHLSVRTVDGYRAAIMDKLRIRTIPGLVKYALKHHLTHLD
jgi:DNA-binding NarL/FixJ family response regulator